MNKVTTYNFESTSPTGGLFLWIEYLLPRLLLGMIFALFLFYGASSFYHHTLFPGGSLPLFHLGLVSTLIALVAGFRIWSAGCKAVFRNNLKRAGSALQTQDNPRALKYFHKAGNTIRSAYFFNSDRQTENLLLQEKMANFYCSAGICDTDALAIYHNYFRAFPDDINFARSVIPLILNSDNISSSHLPLLQNLHNLEPDNDKLVDLLSRHYLANEVFTAESQEALLEIIRKDSSWKIRGLKFLLAHMLEAERVDPRALEVYLEAAKAGLKLKQLDITMGEIAEKVRFDNSQSELAVQLSQYFASMPLERREKITADIRKRRLSRLPVSPPAVDKIVDRKIPLEAEGESIPPSFTFDLRGKLIKSAGILAYPLKKAPVYVGAVKRSLVKNRMVLKWIFIAGFGGIVVFGAVKIISNYSGEKEISLEVVSDKPFTLQVAAFKERERAEIYIRQLAKENIRAYIVVETGKSTWHQVRVGHFETREAAAAAADSLIRDKKINAYFVANFTPGAYIKLSP